VQDRGEELFVNFLQTSSQILIPIMNTNPKRRPNMRKHSVLFTLMAMTFLFVSASAFAGVNGKKPATNDKPAAAISSASHRIPLNPAAVTSVFIDSMANAYGMLGTSTQPLAYDPASNVIAMVHRGFPSGAVFYNYSTDGGATWSVAQGPLNGSTPLTGRYPTGGLSNPTGGTNPTTSTSVVFAYPELVGGDWGGVVYGQDLTVGAGVFTQKLDTNKLWGTTFSVMTSNSSTNGVLLAATDQNSNSISLLKSTDNGATWGSWSVPTSLNGNNLYDTAAVSSKQVPFGIWNLHGWDYVNGAYYLGWQGLRPKGLHDSTEIVYMWSKSTDGGTTWSTADVCQPKTISSLSGMVNYTHGVNSLVDGQEYDFLVDANGNPHFFAVFADTTHNTQGVYELTKVSGAWTATKVASLNKLVNYDGFPQRMNEIGAARTATGNAVAVKWIDVVAAADSIPDVFISGRTLAGAWSTPVNLTNTSQTAGPYYCFTAMANRIGPSGKVYIVWSKDLLGATPTNGVNNLDHFGLEFLNGATVTAVHEQTSDVPVNYSLAQNYPNPFNPTTVISYQVAKASQVSLKIYNVLGQAVANLVNGYQQAGNYKVSFDGSKLSSGVYFYEMRAGSFSQIKKMVLMK